MQNVDEYLVDRTMEEMSFARVKRHYLHSESRHEQAHICLLNDDCGDRIPFDATKNGFARKDLVQGLNQPHDIGHGKYLPQDGTLDLTRSNVIFGPDLTRDDTPDTA
jgi:hypothetical protein